MSGAFRTKVDRELNNYFEMGFQNGVAENRFDWQWWRKVSAKHFRAKFESRCCWLCTLPRTGREQPGAPVGQEILLNKVGVTQYFSE